MPPFLATLSRHRLRNKPSAGEAARGGGGVPGRDRRPLGRAGARVASGDCAPAPRATLAQAAATSRGARAAGGGRAARRGRPVTSDLVRPAMRMSGWVAILAITSLLRTALHYLAEARAYASRRSRPSSRRKWHVVRG